MVTRTEVEKLISAIGALRESQSMETLKNVRNALDGIFVSDAKCVNFIYNLNVDKLPFGCIVMPVMPSDNIINLAISGDPIRFTSYEVELDSKLFDYGLEDDQIAQIMLYNIFHLVSSVEPSKRLREAFDIYFAEMGKTLAIKESVQYQAILAFGMCDALVQLTNCLFIDDDVIGDAYLESLGFEDFRDALDLMFHRIPGCEKVATRRPKLSMLAWCIRLYDDVEHERIPALHTLKRCEEINASKLYEAKMNNVIIALNRIDTDNIIQEAVQTYMTEARRGGSLFAQIRYSGLKAIEEDYYEFVTRSKAAATEDEYLYIIRQINVRLGILDDYIRNEYEKDGDIERWKNLYSRYYDLREEIMNHKVKRNRSYGVWVDYDAIDNMNE